MRRLGRRAALALPAALLASPFAPAARGQGGGQGGSQGGGATHALLLGVNAYRMSPLAGCVNDAQLLAAAFAPHAASVTTLLDRQVTRSGVLAAWAEVAGRCRAGDRMVFGFSGHGAQKPERVRGSEPDGMDEFLVFADFHPSEAPGEILLDKEVEVLLAEQARRGVRVTYIADCCHSGGTSRSVDPRAGGTAAYRTLTGSFDAVELQAVMADMPPPPPAPPPRALEPVLFIAAGTEAQLIPEIIWQGRKHGALSVAVATALAGAADRDGNRSITRGELLAHAMRVTRGLADSRQHPGMEPAGHEGEVFIALSRAARPSGRAPAPGAVLSAGPAVRLRVLNAPAPVASGIARGMPDVSLAAAGREADLVWDAATGEAVSQMGDILASEVAARELAAVAERVRAQRRLAELAAASGLDLRLALASGGGARAGAAADAAHPAGTRLSLHLSGVRLPYFAMVNIAGNGTVQPLYPDRGDPERIATDAPPDIGEFEAKPPYGADLVVAVAGERPMPALLSAFRALDGERRPMALVAALEAALASAGDWQLGLQGVFTRKG